MLSKLLSVLRASVVARTSGLEAAGLIQGSQAWLQTPLRCTVAVLGHSQQSLTKLPPLMTLRVC